MKLFVLLITLITLITGLSALAGSALAGSAFAGNVQYNYDCGNKFVARIRILNGKTSALLSFPGLNRTNILNIVSTSVDTGAPSGDAKKAGLGATVDFSAFHYSSGEHYIAAEGDSNEEGFIFSAEPGILKGQATLQAATIYWNDRRDSDIEKMTCVRR